MQHQRDTADGLYIACHIITLHTMEGEPFLIGLSRMFVFCGDKAFLDRQLIPYLRSMGGESV